MSVLDDPRVRQDGDGYAITTSLGEYWTEPEVPEHGPTTWKLYRDGIWIGALNDPLAEHRGTQSVWSTAEEMVHAVFVCVQAEEAAR